MLDEFYRITFGKKIYATIGELQADLDIWMDEYNQLRTHQGRYCFGKTPMQLDRAREIVSQRRSNQQVTA